MILEIRTSYNYNTCRNTIIVKLQLRTFGTWDLLEIDSLNKYTLFDSLMQLYLC